LRVCLRRRLQPLAERSYGELLKHDGWLSFHSDMPMALAKPLQLVWAGVKRLTHADHGALTVLSLI
jgi:predicted amidohydrolase YtcJ